MRNLKFILYVDTLIKLSVITALIIAATTKQQYDYYTFIRWLVLTTFIYFGYKSYDRKQIGLLIFFGLVAILFNPFKKIWFQKDTWQLIDYIIAGIIVITIINDWLLVYKKSDKSTLNKF